MKLSFLIADDEADIREVVKEAILSNYPQSLVVEASNGSEAAQKAGRQAFDIIISDLKMPKKDGFQLLEALASLNDAVRPRAVLILSAHLTTEISDHLKARGIQYLAKPCSADTLKEAIAKCLATTEQVKDTKPASPVAKVSILLMNSLIGSTIGLFQTNAKMKTIKENIFLRPQTQPSGDVSATAEMTCSTFKGSIGIAFSKKTFIDICTRLLGSEQKDVTPEGTAKATELFDQIFKKTAQALVEHGHQINTGSPVFVNQPAHQIKHIVSSAVIAVKINSEYGPFHIEVSISGVSQQQAA